MIVSGNFQTAKANRQAVTILTGDVYGRTNIIADSGMAGGPHAYLVEQLPNVALPPHFYMTEQFQVVLAGRGLLGRSNILVPLTVHYACGKTAYGPIVANSMGLFYLTLRPKTEYGAHYLSDPKTVVDRLTPKFHTTSSSVLPATADQLASAQTATHEEVITPDASGLAVWLSRLPDGAPLNVSAQEHPADRFYIVTGAAQSCRAKRWCLGLACG